MVTLTGKWITGIAILALSIKTSFAQVDNRWNDVLGPKSTSQNELNALADNFVGSPYLDADFTQGVVYADGEKPAQLFMRYNIHRDLIEVLDNNQIFFIEPNIGIEKIVIGEVKFVVRKFEYQRKLHYGYLELIEGGEISLLAKKLVAFEKIVSTNKNHYARLPDAYFCELDGDQIIHISGIKSLLKIIPAKKEKMKQYSNDQKLSGTDRAELLDFFHHYNSMPK